MPICRGRDGGVRYGSGIINSDDVSIINWREQASKRGEGRGRDGAINSALPPPTSLSAAEAKIEPISHLNLRPPASERGEESFVEPGFRADGAFVLWQTMLLPSGSIFHYFHSESSFEERS